MRPKRRAKWIKRSAIIFCANSLKRFKRNSAKTKRGEKAEAAQLRERLETADLPEEVRKEAERELRRMEQLPQAAPDYHVIRTYLEYVLELPWKKSSEEKLDLDEARKILDEDHYGLEDIKERILESLAVVKLRPDSKSPIILFVGPPGVGKTSLGTFDCAGSWDANSTAFRSAACAMKPNCAVIGELMSARCRAELFKLYGASA